MECRSRVFNAAQVLYEIIAGQETGKTYGVHRANNA